MTCHSTVPGESKWQTVSQPELTEASATTGQKEAVLLKNMGSSDKTRIPEAKKIDIAATLLSRDYKGLSNYASNGAIEWKLDR